ncbi:MAG: queuosine precursor transporter [Treponema sp.]|nr:queuosine precursor transporter [Treponema sp.]
MNELLLCVSLCAAFGGVLLFYRLFGKAGCSVWVALSTILANIEVCMLVVAFGMEQTLGNVLFASSFLATDFLSELYGKKEADRAVWIGIGASALFLVFSWLWTLYIPSDADRAALHIAAIFSRTPRILIASMASYAIAELFDVWLYHRLWAVTQKRSGDTRRFLWFRNNAATLSAQFVNIVLFNVGAFWGVYTVPTLVSITGACYVIYVFTSVLDTPFLYAARAMHARGWITE